MTPIGRLSWRPLRPVLNLRVAYFGHDQKSEVACDASRRGWFLVIRQRKITLGEMREMGVRGVLVYCSDYKRSHRTAISDDRWSDDVRLSDLEPLFVCQSCRIKGADVRPDFNWDRKAAAR